MNSDVGANLTKVGSSKKVLLFIPSTRWDNDKRPWIMVNYASLIITSMLKDKFDFEILDANGSNAAKEFCAEKIAAYSPDVVLITTLSIEYYRQCHEAVAIAKRACPNCKVIVGGVYPTVMKNEVLEKDDKIDYIFLGHAEERLDKFLSFIFESDKAAAESFAGIGYRDHSNGRIVINPVGSYIFQIKEQVKPDYSKTDMNHYINNSSNHYQMNSDEPYTTLVSSYGCPYNCVFCASRTISGKGIAYRKVEDVLEEIDYLKSHYNVKSFIFMDDSMLTDRKRGERLLNELADKKYNIKFKLVNIAAWDCTDAMLELLKKAGCTQITVSVESGSQRVLKEIIRKPLKLEIIPGIVKKCRELNIDMGVNFIIGLPGETWDEIRQTVAYAEKCDFDLVHFHVATPLPETDLYHIARDQKLLPDNFSFFNPDFFGFGKAFITTAEFTPHELEILRAFEWDRINFNTPEKTAKIAKMMGLSVEELNEHRKQTRRKCGIHF
jgi:anaerobic magnesium-protoporphyrin IX monomethyl ester cyclase